MADKPFRVLLDLTDLYLENLKYVWINVSPRELTSISDFKTAVIQKVRLERGDIKLFVREGLLLEQETVNVLREDDTVKVQYEGPLLLNSADNEPKTRKRNRSECNTEEVVHSKEKRYKVDSGISNQSSGSSCFETSTEKNKKRKKPSNSVVSLDKVVDHFDTFESNQNEGKSQKKKDKKKKTTFTENNVEWDSKEYDSFFSFETSDATIKQNENLTCSVVANVSQESSMFDSTKDLSKTDGHKFEKSTENCARESFEKVVVNNCPKKKRKRHRKRKNTGSMSNNDLSNSNFFTAFSSPSEIVDAERKHVWFSSDISEKGSATVYDTVNDISNSPNETFSVQKNVSNNIANDESLKNCHKVSTPTQSAICDKLSWCVSLIQKSSGKNSEHTPCKVKPPKESPVSKIVVKHSPRNSQENKFPSEIEYDNLPVLNFVPQVGTLFVYKTLELDESYSPTVSEYREGIIKRINPNTEEIEIELSKHVIKPGRIGKFENLKEDEIPMPEVKKIDVLKWSDIISPKILP